MTPSLDAEPVAWRTVPAVPTEAMLDAGDEPFFAVMKAQRDENRRAGRKPDAGYGSGPFSEAIYRAMLAAAPAPEGILPGDIVVRRRHGRWMADVCGDTAHSGGWTNPVDAVRDVRPAAEAILAITEGRRR